MEVVLVSFDRQLQHVSKEAEENHKTYEVSTRLTQ